MFKRRLVKRRDAVLHELPQGSAGGGETGMGDTPTESRAPMASVPIRTEEKRHPPSAHHQFRGCCGGFPEPPRPTAVGVAPAEAALAAFGETVQLRAEVRDQAGRVMAGAAVAWTSSDASVAAVWTTRCCWPPMGTSTWRSYSG